VRKRRSDRLDEKMEREVRILFNGRCIICDTVEDLEVIPMFEMKRRNPRACVLLCPKCKARGIPKISPYRRDCARCGHRWFARSKNTVRCPKCGSPYWNTLRR
jgi:ribosomal protein S27AE